ncbi:MAG: ribonuclease HII [Burkholderiaceae bacterium]|jgi:ribonuclease HII
MPFLIGVDEAGRGPLAGPVVAGAVLLHPQRAILGLACSKTLTARKRDSLFVEIQQRASAWAIAEASPLEIDEVNILQATLRAMHRAVDRLVGEHGLDPSDVHVLVDGNRLPSWPYAATAIIRGDASEPCISAASILAKVHRDRFCLHMHTEFPCYGFDRHMGYPTAAHLAQLDVHGPCKWHRHSFAPVRLAASNARQAA